MNTTSELTVRRSSKNRLVLESQDEAVLDKAQVILDLLGVRLEEAERAQVVGLVEKFVEFLAPADVTADVMRAARLQAEARANMLENYGLLSAEDIHELRGSQSANPHSTAARLKRNGLVFSIEYHGRQRFPAYQFDEAGVPISGLDKILTVFGHHLTDWQLAVWFVTPNGWLSGDTPIDRLKAGEIDAVLRAANDEIAPTVY